VQAILCEYIPDARLWDGQPYYVIQTDVTKVIKPHSKTLEGRQYVPVSNNRVPGNKPIDAGCRIRLTMFMRNQAGLYRWKLKYWM